MSDLTIQIDVPDKGLLKLNYSMNDLRLRLYKGPLAQVVISNPVGPEAKFTMPSEDFIILFVKFFQNFNQELR